MPVFWGTAAANVILGSAGADQIYGQAGNDTLYGSGGNDLLNGGVGDDLMGGGLGDDVYYVAAAGDAIVERVGEGTDQVLAWISYQLAYNVEILMLQGTAAINGTGNGLNNTILGNAGNNVLNGGAGSDTLAGGRGDDIYDMDSAGDRAQEAANEGYDRVRSSVSFALGANLEELSLTGAAAINGTGNALANTITGNAGNNVLNGAAGDDLLTGGKGNDIYYVAAAGDRVVEQAGEGTDQVLAWISHQLAANVEILVLQGTGALNGTGNALKNTIIGNAGGNVLNGGAGDDTLAGGKGDDVYDADSAGDRVQEAANEGYDRVRVSVSFTLGANLEELTLTGAAAINGTGNALANSIVGNAAANVLTGGAGDDVLDGKAGNDRMIGGVGNDVYYVNAIGDQVVEADGQGVDQIRSSISCVLGGGLENLELLGTGNINGTGNGVGNALIGNSGANALLGNAGDDTLTGQNGDDSLTGGLGKDRIYGGDGNDILYLNKAEIASGEIYDGGAGDDRFVLLRQTNTTALDITGISISNIESIYSDYDSLTLKSIQLQGFNFIDGDLAFGHSNSIIISDSGSINLSGAYVSSLDFQLSDFGNTLDLSAASSAGTQLGFAVYGGNGNDVIKGNGAYSNLSGGGGNDVLIGSGWSVTIAGDSGNDVIDGSSGGDSLYGGAGKDIVRGGGGNDVLEVGQAGELLSGEIYDGGTGIDTLSFFMLGDYNGFNLSTVNIIGIEKIVSYSDLFKMTVAQLNAFSDIRVGGVVLADGGSVDLTDVTFFNGGLQLSAQGNSVDLTGLNDSLYYSIVGGAGSDTVLGSARDDLIKGNASDDILRGAEGNDQLFGGSGNDSLKGGVGKDTFSFINIGEGVDTVEDFNAIEGDKLLFSKMTHEDFSYIAGSAFTASGGTEVRFANGQVQVDTNGDGVTDITIKMTGITSASQLHASDFIFSLY